MFLAPVLVPSLHPLPPHLSSKEMRRRGKNVAGLRMSLKRKAEDSSLSLSLRKNYRKWVKRGFSIRKKFPKISEIEPGQGKGELSY